MSGTEKSQISLLKEMFGDVVELLLAHTERSQTTASYHHHELESERRRALQFLADKIDQLAASERAGNVVTMRRAVGGA